MAKKQDIKVIPLNSLDKKPEVLFYSNPQAESKPLHDFTIQERIQSLVTEGYVVAEKKNPLLMIDIIKKAGYTVITNDFSDELDELGKWLKDWKTRKAEHVIEHEERKVIIKLSNSMRDQELEEAILEAYTQFGAPLLLDFIRTYLGHFADERKV